ncbi:hypothetical protein KR032_005047 [Drosophila birchii]|nr:hypothetical protein KR032_005047 [Drosophila birchii]
MADFIQCFCDSLITAAAHLTTLRLSEIRQSLDFLGVQHTEVLLGLLVFSLLQFTKFAAIMILAILMAYGIFYLWDNFFPGIAQFGYRGIKMSRNVRTFANLPPFTYSDGEESLALGEYVVNPTPLSGTDRMLVPMLQDSKKVYRSANMQAGSPLNSFDYMNRGSRGQGSSQRESLESGKRRQEQRRYWKPASSEREQEGERSSPRRSGPSTSHDIKRTNNVLRIPKITSGVVDLKQLRNFTSEDLKRLPNITSGESRKTQRDENRRLSTVTSGELGSRRVSRITSHTKETPRWLNMATGVTESRRRAKSSHHQDESRRPTHGGESKYRRSPERPFPAHGRRPEDQPPRHRVPASSDDNRPTKNRRSLNNNSRSGVIRRQYPEDHYERLRMENRDFQARRLGTSSGHPTSEGAMLTQQENFVASFRNTDRRTSVRNPKSSKPGKEETSKSRRDRKKY